MLTFVFLATAASYRGTRGADDRRAARSAARALDCEPERAATEAGGPVRHDGQLQGEPDAGEGDVSPAAADEDSEYTAEKNESGADRKRHRRPRRAKVGWSVRVVASAALLLLAACWLPPYLAQRAESAALADAGDGRVEAALVHARRAARLDPLAVSPLLTEASLLQQLGQNRAALAKLEEAALLQPQNYEVWLALGELQQGALGQVKAARESFTRALALNPADSASRYELERLVH